MKRFLEQKIKATKAFYFICRFDNLMIRYGKLTFLKFFLWLWKQKHQCDTNSCNRLNVIVVMRTIVCMVWQHHLHMIWEQPFNHQLDKRSNTAIIFTVTSKTTLQSFSPSPSPSVPEYWIWPHFLLQIKVLLSNWIHWVWHAFAIILS